jgi:hypothetical protein
MSDIEDEMEETTERAKALGVGGSGPGEDSDPDFEQRSDEGSTPLETSEASETVETIEPEEADPDEREPGGIDSDEYPNPDKELGSLTETYENINVYLPPEVKAEVHSLYKQLDYEFSREFGEELDKHWDFYTAVFRAVLHNPTLVREELGMDEPE